MIETLLNVDVNILLWIQECVRATWLTPLFTFITTLGNAGLIWIVLTAVFLSNRRTRRIGTICCVALILSFLINNMLIKNLVARTRPFYVVDGLTALIPFPKDLSFPSGHTSASFACAWTVFRKMKRRIGIPVLILAILIAISRLYLGVHYPSDVIAGAVSGIMSSCLASFLVTNRFFS